MIYFATMENTRDMMHKMPHCVEENVSLAPYTAFAVGGTARFFARTKTRKELKEVCLWAQQENISVKVLGGGSNILMADGVIDALVVTVLFDDIEVRSSGTDNMLVSFGGGVVWDDAVRWSVQKGLSGIEALSAIPGTVGGAPVQNIGAYGAEISDILEEVEIFDLTECVFRTLTHAECSFGYRDSVFKRELAGRVVIVSALLRLSLDAPRVPEYPGVREELQRQGVTRPTVSDIREAIVAIRARKLPDPSVVPNVGSFFKNPIVSESVAGGLSKEYPDMPKFVERKGVKIPAGWLIEHAGLKGISFGGVATYKNNALVLTNTGRATHQDILDAQKKITDTVYEKFGIVLEREPVLF